MTNILITNTYTDGSGNRLNGTVTFTPVMAASADSFVIVADAISASVANGSLSVSLRTTDSFGITTGTMSYRVHEQIGSTIKRSYYIVVPASLGSSVILANLTTWDFPPGTVIIDAATQVDLTTLTNRVTALEADVAAPPPDATQIAVIAQGNISGSTVQAALAASADQIATLTTLINQSLILE